MKATDLLEEQHREVRALFKRLESEEDPAQQRDLFEEIAKNLVAHDAIERELFYPECETRMGMNDTLGEALVEHGVVEFCLFEADEARADQFKYKCTVLREMLEHHIDEEEEELFPKAEVTLGDERLQALGEKMQARFEEVQQSDFRVPLHDNLRQVLSGAIKTHSSTKAGSSEATATTRSRASTKEKRSSSRNGIRRHT
jgi:hemerythrin superfamily protein